MNPNDKPEETALEFDCELPQPPEKVWRVLTEPELLAAWLLPNDIRGEVGERFRLREENGGTIDCEVLDAEPNKRLRYSWRAADTDGVLHPDTIVTFTLTETTNGGTYLRVVHSGFPAIVREVPAVDESEFGKILMFKRETKQPVCAANAGVFSWAA